MRPSLRLWSSLSIALAAALALAGGAGCSADASEEDVAGDDTNEVNAKVIAPLGTYRATDSVQGIDLEVKVVFRSDGRWFTQMSGSCKGGCTDEKQAMIDLVLPRETSLGWGTFEVKRSKGKNVLLTKLADDSPELEGFTETADTFVLDGDALTMTAADGEVTHLVKMEEGACHEDADCMNQGLKQTSCGTGEFVCFEGVCESDGPTAACSP